jgi:hypothetical protein
MRIPALRYLCSLSLAAVLAACAAPISHSPAEMTAADQRRVQLARQIEVRLDTGYVRTLKAGSQWIRIGKLPQGDAYKAYQDVFTLEGANVHEAYLVVAGDSLVGFYLPVERGFTPLKNKVSVALN